MSDQLINLFYIAAAVLFIFGLKMLGSPATARRGNTLCWPFALSTSRGVRSVTMEARCRNPDGIQAPFVLEKSSHIGVIPAFYPMASLTRK